jgi:pimeloyl-ACP methyl ester carboxylesterase
MEKVSFDAGYSEERMFAHIFMPKRINPPHQTIVHFPDDSAVLIDYSISEYGYEIAEFFTKDGRAVVIPAFKGTLERRYESLPPGPGPPHSWSRYHVLLWRKEMSQLLDYLETRQEFDTEKVAYFGISGSAGRPLAIFAVEDRIKAAILLSGGFHDLPPEISLTNFLPRINIPVIMINGRYDWRFPVEKNQKPMLRLFGTPEEDKYHKIYESGHNLLDKRQWVRDALTFLDKYFGQPQRIEKQGRDN